MEPTFEGKRALVTGAGKGIGRAITVKLASLGAHVVALSRTQADLDSLKAECPSVEVCLLDIQDWDTTRETVEKLGHFDLLVNNAGVSTATPFLEVTREELDSTHNINFRAAYNISQVVAKSMVDKGTGGAIVNVSSIGSKRAFTFRTPYCTSKAALDMLTKTLALELGPSKIRVNSVNPTIVMTQMGKEALDTPEKLEGFKAVTPLRNVAEEEHVVDAVVFLLSDKASMTTGVTMVVDGGLIVKCQ